MLPIASPPPPPLPAEGHETTACMPADFIGDGDYMGDGGRALQVSDFRGTPSARSGRITSCWHGHRCYGSCTDGSRYLAVRVDTYPQTEAYETWMLKR